MSEQRAVDTMAEKAEAYEQAWKAGYASAKAEPARVQQDAELRESIDTVLTLMLDESLSAFALREHVRNLRARLRNEERP